MGFNNLATLSKLSNFVQISVLILVFLSALLQISKFVLDNKIKHLKNTNTQARFSSIESKPDFDQSMWEMMTGIPAIIFKDYHSALDLWDLKKYSECAETVQLSIDAYEKKENWDQKRKQKKVRKRKQFNNW